MANSDTGSGGLIQFSDQSDGGTCQVQAFGNGSLDISAHDAPGVTIGSLEGDGQVFLGGNNLSVGSNDLSTAFSGIIQGAGGSLTKIGTGTLTLSGANTYTGGRQSKQALCWRRRKWRRPPAPDPFRSMPARLGAEAGSRARSQSGVGAARAPFAPGINSPAGLAIRGTLTFNSDGVYNCELNTNTARSDKVAAKGVTINSGALFSFVARGNQTLTQGTVFTVINNTSANPIAGTFANLPDNSIFTVGPNNYQVSYEGGTGNDLTLTVVP